MPLLHVLNLDTIGGVEELFVHFLKNASVQAKHKVLVTGNKPHPFFKEYLNYADSVSLEKFVGPIKIPSALRKWKRRHALSRSGADLTLLWNRIEEYPWPGVRIYYEHGASWIQTKNAKSCSFFHSIDKILANSNAAKRVLELKWNVKAPISVIENPLKPTIKPASVPRKAPKQFHIGYIGRLIPLKGASLILHAVKALHRPVTLSIAGDGSERKALEVEASRLGIHVTFCGNLQNVMSFYDSIDLLIVPSIREPLGLVAQEAALRGCPVIGALVDGLPEVIQHGITGFCVPPELDIAHYPSLGGKTQNLPDLVYDPLTDTLIPPKLVNPNMLAQYIAMLMDDPALYEAMSRNAIRFASQRPTFCDYTARLLTALN